MTLLANLGALTEALTEAHDAMDQSRTHLAKALFSYQVEPFPVRSASRVLALAGELLCNAVVYQDLRDKWVEEVRDNVRQAEQ